MTIRLKNEQFICPIFDSAALAIMLELQNSTLKFDSSASFKTMLRWKKISGYGPETKRRELTQK